MLQLESDALPAVEWQVLQLAFPHLYYLFAVDPEPRREPTMDYALYLIKITACGGHALLEIRVLPHLLPRLFASHLQHILQSIELMLLDFLQFFWIVFVGINSCTIWDAIRDYQPLEIR